jgi:hypothetical protein
LPAHHIDEVVENLDRIIKHSDTESRLEYFPALYRKVTLLVARGISQSGRGDDGLINFRLTKARDCAWQAAERLVAAS